MRDRSSNGKPGFLRTASSGSLALVFLVVLLAGAGLGILGSSLFSGDDEDEASPVPGAVADGELVVEGGPGDRYRAQFWTRSLFPEFSPGQRRYVTRCGSGKAAFTVNALDGARVAVEGNPPETGYFEAEARPVPGQDFGIRISGAGPKLDGRYSVRCLPTNFPGWYYERVRTPPRGLFTVAFRPLPLNRNRAWIITFDQDGVPRWWLSTNTNALWAEVLPDGELIWGRGFGDGFGQDSRTGIQSTDLTGAPGPVSRTRGTPTDSHEYVRLPDGNALLMSYKPRLGVDLSRFGLGSDVGVLDGEIQEVDPQGRVVWRWNSGDHIGFEQTPPRWWKVISENPHPDSAGRDRYDYFHLNSIEPIGRDRLLISTRHTDAVFAISRSTGEVLWKLGGTPTDRSLRVTGPDPGRDWPLSGAHDARLENGILSIHDNGTRAGRPPRVAFFRIDPEAGTARYLYQINPTKGVRYSHCCGGARKLGDGWVVTWGGSKLIGGYDSNRKLAFVLGLPQPSYRVVPVPASVDPAAFDRALDATEESLGPPGDAIRPVERITADDVGSGAEAAESGSG